MSLMSDVTHQVKHPLTCIIHSPFTGGGVQKCVQIKTCYAYMSSSLVGSSSSGGGVERGKGYEQTAALAMWWNHA